MHKNKQTKLLKKAYYKNLKDLNRYFFKKRNTGLLLFSEYLKYLRDTMIIDDTSTQGSIATITTAIAEFEAYTNVSNKSFHWNNFCELVKQNMEEWMHINDSV